MLYSILISLQVLVALGLIALILLQQGKGADAGAAFGSGASSTVFGARGSASFLTRMTAVFAFVFLANSLLLAVITSRTVERTSLVEELVTDSVIPVPANDAAPSDIPEDLLEEIKSALPEGVDVQVLPGDVPSADLPPAMDDGQPADVTDEAASLESLDMGATDESVPSDMDDLPPADSAADEP